jgi:hypothetical protein
MFPHSFILDLIQSSILLSVENSIKIIVPAQLNLYVICQILFTLWYRSLSRYEYMTLDVTLVRIHTVLLHTQSLIDTRLVHVQL